MFFQFSHAKKECVFKNMCLSMFANGTKSYFICCRNRSPIRLFGLALEAVAQLRGVSLNPSFYGHAGNGEIDGFVIVSKEGCSSHCSSIWFNRSLDVMVPPV